MTTLPDIIRHVVAAVVGIAIVLVGIGLGAALVGALASVVTFLLIPDPPEGSAALGEGVGLLAGTALGALVGAFVGMIAGCAAAIRVFRWGWPEPGC